jgi:tellurite methyltransferase
MPSLQQPFGQIDIYLTAKLGTHLVDPIKTTVVQNQRCMTTWILRKDR